MFSTLRGGSSSLPSSSRAAALTPEERRRQKSKRTALDHVRNVINKKGSRARHIAAGGTGEEWDALQKWSEFPPNYTPTQEQEAVLLLVVRRNENAQSYLPTAKRMAVDCGTDGETDSPGSPRCTAPIGAASHARQMEDDVKYLGELQSLDPEHFPSGMTFDAAANEIRKTIYMFAFLPDHPLGFLARKLLLEGWPGVCGFIEAIQRVIAYMNSTGDFSRGADLEQWIQHFNQVHDPRATRQTQTVAFVEKQLRLGRHVYAMGRFICEGITNTLKFTEPVNNVTRASVGRWFEALLFDNYVSCLEFDERRGALRAAGMTWDDVLRAMRYGRGKSFPCVYAHLDGLIVSVNGTEIDVCAVDPNTMEVVAQLNDHMLGRPNDAVNRQTQNADAQRATLVKQRSVFTEGRRASAQSAIMGMYKQCNRDAPEFNYEPARLIINILQAFAQRADALQGLVYPHGDGQHVDPALMKNVVDAGAISRLAGRPEVVKLVQEYFSSLETLRASEAETPSAPVSAKERATWLMKSGFVSALSESGCDDIAAVFNKLRLFIQGVGVKGSTELSDVLSVLVCKSSALKTILGAADATTLGANIAAFIKGAGCADGKSLDLKDVVRVLGGYNAAVTLIVGADSIEAATALGANMVAFIKGTGCADGKSLGLEDVLNILSAVGGGGKFIQMVYAATRKKCKQVGSYVAAFFKGMFEDCSIELADVLTIVYSTDGVIKLIADAVGDAEKLKRMGCQWLQKNPSKWRGRERLSGDGAGVAVAAACASDSSSSASSSSSSTSTNKKRKAAASPKGEADTSRRRKTQKRQIRQAWTKAEDQALAAAVKELGKQWKDVAAQCRQKIQGFSRTPKRCRDRWVNQVDPNIDWSSFTKEEDEKIVTLVREHGTKWAKIGKELPRRPPNAIKNRWNRGLKKRFADAQPNVSSKRRKTKK